MNRSEAADQRRALRRADEEATLLSELTDEFISTRRWVEVKRLAELTGWTARHVRQVAARALGVSMLGAPAVYAPRAEHLALLLYHERRANRG